MHLVSGNQNGVATLTELIGNFHLCELPYDGATIGVDRRLTATIK
jgi:hypothetical protein